MEPYITETRPSQKQLGYVANAIRRNIQLMIDQGHCLGHLADPWSSYQFVKTLSCNNGIWVMIDKYTKQPIGAIGFSIAPLWWSKGRNALVEEFVVLIDEDFAGFGRIAVDHLEYIAKSHDCAVVYSGNFLGTQQKQVENLYMKKNKFDLKIGQFVKVM